MKRWLVWGGIALLVVVVGVIAWGFTGSQLSATVVRERDGKVITNAKVTVDGANAPVSAGVLAAKYALGDHKLTITAPGYETVEKMVKLDIFRKTDVGKVGLRNADLTLTAVENFPGYPELKKASFVVGDRKIEATESEAKLEDLPIGKTAVVVSAPGCEDTSLTVELVPGANSAVCTVTPDLAVVAKRSAQNVMDRDFELTYAILHPARQKQWGTKAQYIKRWEAQDKENEGQVTWLGFKVLTPTKLDTYKDKPSKQTYKDVYKVPVTFRASSPLLAMFGMKEMQIKDVGYWILVDGQWRTLGDGEAVAK